MAIGGPRGLGWPGVVFVLGVGALIFGVLWIVEGLGLTKGTFLIARQSAAYVGGVAVLVGTVLAGWGWSLLGKADERRRR